MKYTPLTCNCWDTDDHCGVYPWILGLTGGIGSGKSAAAERFVELGVHLVDADQAARWVVEPGRPALASIVERFGAGVLQADGQLDRAALRQLIFADPAQRKWLSNCCTR